MLTLFTLLACFLCNGGPALPASMGPTASPHTTGSSVQTTPGVVCAELAEKPVSPSQQSHAQELWPQTAEERRTKMKLFRGVILHACQPLFTQHACIPARIVDPEAVSVIVVVRSHN